MPPISSKLRQLGAKDNYVRKEPLWTGPCGKGPNGGISYSMLSRFLNCHERFRIYTIEGLMPSPTFRPPLDFGNMWHICEEGYARDGHWIEPLQTFCNDLCKKYRTQQPQIQHWYSLCKAEFPLYLELWDKHQQDTGVEYLFQEKPFDVPYKLPSGTVVRLRGKWDGAFKRLSKDWSRQELWLQENKTKSQIDVVGITRQLSFDLQTMLYICALEQSLQANDHNYPPLTGVHYNVVRRSAHKSAESMTEKIQLDFRTGRIREWFDKFDVTVTQKDIILFKETCLHPLLQTVNNWYEATVAGADGYIAHPFRHPYGVRNLLDDGGSTDYDNFLLTGSRVGLSDCFNLFPELQEDPKAA